MTKVVALLRARTAVQIETLQYIAPSNRSSPKEAIQLYVEALRLRLKGDEAHKQGQLANAVHFYESAFGLNVGDSESLFKAG